MKFLFDTAFVVKRNNIGEADRFITVFSKNHGKQELVAKGIRKITSKRISHIELLNEIKFHAVSTRKNFILTEIEVINTFSNIKESKSAIGFLFLICELIDRLCPLNQKHDDVYNLVKNTLYQLNSNDQFSTIRTFELDLLASLGFWDSKKKFKGDDEIEKFIEGIIERKLRSKFFLGLRN